MSTLQSHMPRNDARLVARIFGLARDRWPDLAEQQPERLEDWLQAALVYMFEDEFGQGRAVAPRP